MRTLRAVFNVRDKIKEGGGGGLKAAGSTLDAVIVFMSGIGTRWNPISIVQ